MQTFPIDAAALAVALPVPAHAGADTVQAFLHHVIRSMHSLRVWAHSAAPAGPVDCELSRAGWSYGAIGFRWPMQLWCAWWAIKHAV